MNYFKFTRNSKCNGLNFRKLEYGIWAIQILDYGILSSKHISFLKLYIHKNMKKVKKYKFNIILNKVFTRKSLETRMGGGKGVIYDIQSFVRPGYILIEFYEVSLDFIFTFFKIIKNKISLKLNLIKINLC